MTTVTIDELGTIYNDVANRKRDGVRFVMCGAGIPLPDDTLLKRGSRWITAADLKAIDGYDIMDTTKLRRNGFNFAHATVALRYKRQPIASIEFGTKPGKLIIFTDDDAYIVNRETVVEMTTAPA